MEEKINEEQYLEPRKNNKLIIIMGAIICVLLIAVGVLLYLNINNNNDNNTNNQNDKVIDKKMSQEETDEENTRYVYMKKAIEDDMINLYNDFSNDKWKAYAIFMASENVNIIKYENGYAYDKCNDYNSLTDVEHTLCYFHLTEEEFNKVDKSLFTELYGGSIQHNSYHLDEIKNEIEKIYGTYSNAFDNSFRVSYGNCPQRRYVYSSGINKVFNKNEGGCTGGIQKNKIINESNENNKYVFTYVKYLVNNNYVYDENNNKLYEIDTINDLKIEEHADLFNKKYTAVFNYKNDIFFYTG